MMQVKQISDNEIYLLIKYIKSVLWGVAKRLSYTEDARCLKVKEPYRTIISTLNVKVDAVCWLRLDRLVRSGNQRSDSNVVNPV